MLHVSVPAISYLGSLVLKNQKFSGENVGWFFMYFCLPKKFNPNINDDDYYQDYKTPTLSWYRKVELKIFQIGWITLVGINLVSAYQYLTGYILDELWTIFFAIIQSSLCTVNRRKISNNGFITNKYCAGLRYFRKSKTV